MTISALGWDLSGLIDIIGLNPFSVSDQDEASFSATSAKEKLGRTKAVYDLSRAGFMQL